MKKIMLTAIVALGTFIGIQNSQAADPNIKVYNFVGTAAASPSNSICQQNIMSYMDKGGVIGSIPTDVANNPAALNMPNILRACNFIWSPFNSWDATNGPTGAFDQQYGSRIIWGLDWKQTTPFLASAVYFDANSSEPANSLHYSGNVATNTADGTPLTFSSTFRGELWNSDGTVTSYYNGEVVATHPINRLLYIVKEGWYAADTNGLGLDLNYFRDHMPMSASIRFYMIDGPSGSKKLSSVPYLDSLGTTNKFGMFQLEGQRQLGITYTILGTPSMNDPISWAVVNTGVLDGYLYTGTNYPNYFYKAAEERTVKVAGVMTKTIGSESPILRISNSPE